MRRTTRSILAVTAFLIGFDVLLIGLANYILLPGWRAAAAGGEPQRKVMAAYAALLMVVLLALLITGLIVVLRIRRTFLGSAIKGKTQYVDAWAEAGRRVE